MATVKIKSKRLTNSLRHSIKNQAEDWKFKKDKEALKKLGTTLGDEVYNYFYSVEVQEMIKTLPEFMIRDSKTYLALSDDKSIRELLESKNYKSSQRWFSSIYFQFSDGKNRDLLGTFFDFEDLVKMKKENRKLWNKLVKFVTETVKLQDRRKSFKEKLTELMNQITTTKKLIELLPDAIHWMPEVYECNDLPAADQVAQLLDV